jgi:hypothetical protein|tara:strand:+ start:765 stop:1112 length:348 start_codon:yes stop_codon:yes gene_type:complete
MSKAESNRRYWKTISGKLMMTYNNMNRRVRGYVKPHLYNGLELCTREEFYSWSSTNESFVLLYKEWVDSDYSRSLSPSIDRIDSSLGYTFENMQWITLSENSRRGANSRWRDNDS